MSQSSIFSRIIKGELPADILYQDEMCICIKDIHPQAPTHLLVIPKKPLVTLADATEEDKAMLGHLLLKVGDIARDLGVDKGFRVVINNGESAGQTVPHLHLHILAQKKFAENSLGMH